MIYLLIAAPFVITALAMWLLSPLLKKRPF
jgi:hypothetical protein